MRIFADTNVLFDIFAQRAPYVASARKLMIMQAFGDAEIWAAPQSYLDIFYVLRKARPEADVQRALAASLDRINLCTTSHEDVRKACAAGWDDVEDALVGLSCKKVAADYLLTRDESQAGFKTLGIPSLTPEAFFEMLENDLQVTYDEIEW